MRSDRLAEKPKRAAAFQKGLQPVLQLARNTSKEWLRPTYYQ